MEAKKVVLRYVKSKGATMSDDDWNLIVETEKAKVQFFNYYTSISDKNVGVNSSRTLGVVLVENPRNNR